MKQFKVVKKIGDQKIEMVADESQLPVLKSDGRFEIGEEIKPEKKGKKEKETAPETNPPAELPESTK